MLQDNINGCFETISGFFCMLHCIRLWKDKSTKGVSFIAFIFFAIWGLWNLYYYPSIGQIMSFIGGCHVVFWNLMWVVLAVYYGRKK